MNTPPPTSSPLCDRVGQLAQKYVESRIESECRNKTQYRRGIIALMIMSTISFGVFLTSLVIGQHDIAKKQIGNDMAQIDRLLRFFDKDTYHDTNVIDERDYHKIRQKIDREHLPKEHWVRCHGEVCTTYLNMSGMSIKFVTNNEEIVYITVKDL
ncbi:hypothetical protein [Vibrio cholerae]|uniref:hypothetical protein n=1 Tax=Vibrio cholerae TaxID=666 RepID=UPI0011D8C6E6|nr:hypothetical protein [Vibrio cholerae]TXY52042.1 hypothetical protein FXE74_18815 [Vibrio cholerae]GIB31919.1 hypothetical protein VCSRO91_2865 [Vibrio cholerae]